MNTETLSVQKRTEKGKLATRRLRREGRLPATIYGHNEPAESLSVCADELGTTLRRGTKVVQLEGALQGQALLQQIQWDTFAREVLHIDLLRVAKGERVKVEIELAGRGEAPGENEGGVITWTYHVVEIEVIPADIPERLHIDLTKIGLGDSATAADILDLPAGATLVTPAEEVLVTCTRAMVDEEDLAPAATDSEPEIIKKSADESDEGAEE